MKEYSNNYKTVYSNTFEKDELDVVKSPVKNLKVYKRFDGNKKHKIIRKFLPYVVVSTLFLEVMHLVHGFSLDNGNIMQRVSYEYGADEREDAYYMDGKNYLTYRSAWKKDGEEYYREVKTYNGEMFSDERVRDILIHKDDRITVMDDCLISSKVEYERNIPLNEKIFNSSSMRQDIFNSNGFDSYGNVGMAGAVDLLFLYSLLEFGGAFLYKKYLKSYFLDEEECYDDNVINFIEARDKISRKRRLAKKR